MTAALGADFGGTNRRLVCVDDAGTVLAERVRPTGPDRSPDALIDELIADIRSVGSDDRMSGIGLALPGTVFPGGSQKPGMTNLPQLADVRFAERVGEALGLACRCENDAQAAMRGEWRFGAAEGCRNALAVTLGTGIGSGLLLDGAIRTGAHGSGGEIGLFPVRDDAGARNVLEALAAPGQLPDRHGTDAETLLRALAEGEANAEWDAFFDHIGAALAQAHLLLDLECVVVCGAVTETGETLRKGIEAAFRRYCPDAYRFGCEILLSRLGAASGAIGVAVPFLEEAEP